MKTYSVIEMVTRDLGCGEWERWEKIVFEGSHEDCCDMYDFLMDIIYSDEWIEEEEKTDIETDFRIGRQAKEYEKWCDWDE